MKRNLEILQNYLCQKNIDSEIISVLKNHDYNCLEWESQHGWRNRVYDGSVLIIYNNIRAYQEERFNERQGEIYKYSLVILTGSKQEFKWDLVQVDRDESRFECLYLGQHNKSIIHIHRHELQISILSYSNEVLKRINFKSELINRKGNIISIERIQKENKDKPVELIELPELNKLKSITYEESEELNLRPTGNFPVGYLSNK